MTAQGERAAEVWRDPAFATAWTAGDTFGDLLALPRAIAAALVAHDRPRTRLVLDIGSGPGAFLAAFLDRFPDAVGVWSDASEAMRDVAGERLARFGDRVGYRLGDMTDLAGAGLPAGADVVLTSRAAHHLDAAGLAAFYAEAAELLNPGGWLINLDHTGAVGRLGPPVPRDPASLRAAAAGRAPPSPQLPADQHRRPPAGLRGGRHRGRRDRLEGLLHLPVRRPPRRLTAPEAAVPTRTTTQTTHYHVQKKRRAEFIEQWRQHRQTVVRLADVPMADTARGMRRGVYVGADGDRPTRSMDATAHEIDPGVTSTLHRHSWDAMLFVVAGWGWTEIDGERIDWGPGDSLHLPAWAWHRHGNPGADVCRFLSFGSGPLLETMGLAMQEDATSVPIGGLPGRPPYTPPIDGDDPYARRVRRLARDQQARRSGRLHTSWADLQMRNTPRGTRTTFLLDRAIGYQASGITMAMFEIAPGRAQSMHRHPGEAWLYVVDGTGHSYLGTEPEGGEYHPWQKGDLIVVDHFLWHQHLNTDPGRTARVVRIHMFDSLLETMRALCDPLVLFEEPPEHIRDAQAGDPSTVDWPELTRPTWP